MNQQLMSYKYDYDAKVSNGFYMTKHKLMRLLVMLVVLPLMIFFVGFNPLALIIWLVLLAFALFSSSTKRIILSPRYVLCGNKIIYYRNISTIELNNRTGKMLINCTEIKTNMVIDREKFPTNANKPHKITNNKNKKFQKVTEKIVNKTKQVNPSVNLNIKGTIVFNEDPQQY